MTSQYRHRRTSNPSTTFPNPLEPGEIAVNTANRQLAAGDANSGTLGVPLALIAVRFFDVRAIYAANDLVCNVGVVYRAIGAAGPGAFTPAQWSAIAGVLDPRYVQKVGDTMTGALTMATTGHNEISLIKASGGAFTNRIISSTIDGTAKFRWQLRFSDTALESGSNAGSNFSLYRYADDGSLANPAIALIIDRASGQATFSKPVISTLDPAQPTELATKRYVDASVQQSAGAASDVTVVPTGDISATNAQAALAELDAEKVKKSGDSMSGALIVTPKGSWFGQAGGTAATGALQVADVNIKLYDGGGGNWGGIGADPAGNVWIRAALVGSPAAVAWADTSGFLNITKDPTADTHVANKKYVDGGSVGFLKTTARQTITGGFRVAAFNLGNASTGPVQPEPYNGNYQYISNNAAFTISAPGNDCAIDILITNAIGAGVVSFVGFTVSASTGDPITTLTGARFIVSIRRINAFSTYTVKQVA